MLPSRTLQTCSRSLRYLARPSAESLGKVGSAVDSVPCGNRLLPCSLGGRAGLLYASVQAHLLLPVVAVCVCRRHFSGCVAGAFPRHASCDACGVAKARLLDDLDRARHRRRDVGRDAAGRSAPLSSEGRGAGGCIARRPVSRRGAVASSAMDGSGATAWGSSVRDVSRGSGPRFVGGVGSGRRCRGHSAPLSTGLCFHASGEDSMQRGAPAAADRHAKRGARRAAAHTVSATGGSVCLVRLLACTLP